MEHRTKDPERVRLGRVGALTVHARGRTNVAPAREAWEQALAAEFGITDELPPSERTRRLRLAMRVRMSRLARTRWANKKAAPAIVTPEAAQEARRARDERPSAA
jgi:hypothetical protein